MSEKASNFKDLRKISTKSTKSTGCLGFRGLPAYAGIYIRKRYFFFFILLFYEQNPRHPKIAVDFVDIVDIFRKASNHAGLLNRGRVDILWMSTRTGDDRRG